MNVSSTALAEKFAIRQGLKELESRTCVRFLPRTSQKDYVDIINDQGCYSFIGKIGGRQTISLQRDGCIVKGTIIHEFIHALGYDHMQNRDDRDDYVIINLENVDPTKIGNFAKVGSIFGNFNTSYEYASVMHYSRKAFSINGGDTVVPRDSRYLNKIGSSELAPGDVERIRKMYDC
jgi:Astacin (Peptidase family M12A)